MGKKDRQEDTVGGSPIKGLEGPREAHGVSYKPNNTVSAQSLQTCPRGLVQCAPHGGIHTHTSVCLPFLPIPQRQEQEEKT